MPPRSAVPEPIKSIPLTALYGYLTYRNARAFGRSYRLINQQPQASPAQAYSQLAALHWSFAQTGAVYTLRAMMPETQVAHMVINAAVATGFAINAYKAKNNAQILH